MQGFRELAPSGGFRSRANCNHEPSASSSIKAAGCAGRSDTFAVAVDRYSFSGLQRGGANRPGDLLAFHKAMGIDTFRISDVIAAFEIMNFAGLPAIGSIDR